MRRTPVLAAAAAVLALAGCSSTAGKPAAVPAATSVPSSVATTAPPAPDTSSSQPAAPAETCATPLPDSGDIIVRETVPNLPASAQELGGTDPEHCVLTFDTLKTSSPTGAGYCTQAAWAADNPGYDVNATPAPLLKKVRVTIGDCG